MLSSRLGILDEKITKYATFVQKMIEKSINGLLNKNKDELIDVIDSDEAKANSTELELEDLCISTIAQFQPLAGDLRKIIMILKINNDLERMADHAVNIAESASFIIDRPALKPLIDVPRMAEETIRILFDSITSYINLDSGLAESVFKRDDIVDGLRDQVFRELSTYMASSPSCIDRALQLMNIARNLERISDLSTNICEDVIYIIKGKVIKHHNIELSPDKTES